MPFDPSHPLPSNTLQNIRATGVGQASLGRLWVALWGGGVAAAAVANTDLWWLAFWPAALAALGAYGVLAKEAQRLQIAHHPSRRRRVVLRVASGAALGVALACAIAGAAVAVGALLGVEWVLEMLE